MASFQVNAAFLLGLLGAAAVGSAAAEPVRLVALGDSLTAGYQLPPDAAFPVVLEKALRAKGFDVRVENAGVSGDTTSAGRDRLDWAVPDGIHGVILELGANDALRGIDPGIARASLDEIVARLKARGIRVLMAGMLAPPNNGPEYGRAFNAIFPDLAQKHGLMLYPFFLEGVAADQALNQPDMLHPNRAGVEVIVRRMLPTVEAFVASLAKTR